MTMTMTTTTVVLMIIITVLILVIIISMGFGLLTVSSLVIFMCVCFVYTYILLCSQDAKVKLMKRVAVHDFKTSFTYKYDIINDRKGISIVKSLAAHIFNWTVLRIHKVWSYQSEDLSPSLIYIYVNVTLLQYRSKKNAST